VIGQGETGVVAEVKDEQVKVDWKKGSTWSSSNVLRTLPEGFFLGQQVFIEDGPEFVKGAVGKVSSPGNDDGTLVVDIPMKQELRLDGRKKPDYRYQTYAPNVKPMSAQGGGGCVIC